MSRKLTSYNLFVQGNFRKVMKENKGKKPTIIMTKVAKKWQSSKGKPEVTFKVYSNPLFK